MDRIGNEKGKLRFIVLPLQPETADQYDGVGLALHFLLGNTVVLNTNLKEFWFGWRTSKLYPTREELKTYLLGQNEPMAFKQLSQEQKIRFWLYGRVKGDVAALSIYDSVADSHAETEIRFSTQDHLVRFRQPCQESQQILHVAESTDLSRLDLFKRCPPLDLNFIPDQPHPQQEGVVVGFSLGHWRFVVRGDLLGFHG